MRNYPYKTRHRLSETQLRKRLEKQGWKVWRGGFVHAFSLELYPNVRRWYWQLKNLICEMYGEPTWESLCYISYVHHGMPDFICYHPILKECKFVECKLGHEQLSKRQVLTIQKLDRLGFVTEIHKLVDPCTKTREANVDLVFKKKEILEQELTLRKFKR